MSFAIGIHAIEVHLKQTHALKLLENLKKSVNLIQFSNKLLLKIYFISFDGTNWYFSILEAENMAAKDKRFDLHIFLPKISYNY